MPRKSLTWNRAYRRSKSTKPQRARRAGKIARIKSPLNFHGGRGSRRRRG